MAGQTQPISWDVEVALSSGNGVERAIFHRCNRAKRCEICDPYNECTYHQELAAREPAVRLICIPIEED